MKNLVKGLILAVVLGLGIVLGMNCNKPNQEIKSVAAAEEKEVETKEEVGVEFVWYQEDNTQELEGYYLEAGDTLVELTDGSWAISNIQQNYYVFQPVDLGDWDYSVESPQQLENIIKTYLSIKNTGMF